MKKVILACAFFSNLAFAQSNVLMIGTSHQALGETGNTTGVWLSELTHAYDQFTQADMQVDFASIDGKGFPLDPGSLDDMDLSAKSFLTSEKAREMLSDEAVLSLTEALNKKYDAIYLIGGHGVMWDFKGNPELDKIITKADTNNAIIGAVCHGVAGLLTATDAEGKPLIENKKITGFSDEEEQAIKLDKVVPFSLEQDLKAAKAQYSQANEDFTSYAVVDGRLVTGQNPSSATEVAQLMIKSLNK